MIASLSATYAPLFHFYFIFLKVRLFENKSYKRDNAPPKCFDFFLRPFNFCLFTRQDKENLGQRNINNFLFIILCPYLKVCYRKRKLYNYRVTLLLCMHACTLHDYSIDYSYIRQQTCFTKQFCAKLRIRRSCIYIYQRHDDIGKHAMQVLLTKIEKIEDVRDGRCNGKGLWLLSLSKPLHTL